MAHDLNTRLGHVRMALCDPRLTNRQQKMLAALVTFMPFDTEEGWNITTSDLAKSIYFSRNPTDSQLRNARRVIAELEGLGLIARIYAGDRINMQSEVTFYVNWDRLLDPYREAFREEKGPGHLDPESGSPWPALPYTYQRTHTSEDPRPRLEVVR